MSADQIVHPDQIVRPVPRATCTPAIDRVLAAYALIADVDRPEVWIDLRHESRALSDAAAVDARTAAGEHLPLAGLVVAVKGNIDIAGLPTTAGCPTYATGPADRDATAVGRLRAAGAVVLGSTNLDQFATGLVGTRSPYGAVRHATHPDRISGGSSSGSAVAVALGIADAALGTDTAGSGRVPAALHGIVGLKPTRGLVPATGVVPACRSLDCVAVFARSIAVAELVLDQIAGPDDGDPLSRPRPAVVPRPHPSRESFPAPGSSAAPRATDLRPVVGIPLPGQLDPLAPGWAQAFDAAAAQLAVSGVRLEPVDITDLLAVARLLYDGAFVAERYAAVGDFVQASPDDVEPTVRAIVLGSREVSAHQLFRDTELLDHLRARCRRTLADLDALLLPTTTSHPTLAEVAADPVGVNSSLGRFTNFANLLDLAAIAVPAGEVDGLPFGVQLLGPAFTDRALADLGRRLTGEAGVVIKAGVPAADRAITPAPVGGSTAAGPRVSLVVVGAHLTGQPLNAELVSRGGVLDRPTSTAPTYRLHALATTPPKPGLERVTAGGSAIEVELWALPAPEFADLVATLPSPMAIGPVELADGTTAPGFLCEPQALANSREITEFGGWRAYRATLDPDNPDT